MPPAPMPASTPSSLPSLPASPSGLLRIPEPLLKWPDLYTQATLAAQLDAHGGITTPLSRQCITELFALVSSVFSSTFATGAQLAAARTLVDDVMARIIAAAPHPDSTPTPPTSLTSSPAASKQSFREGVPLSPPPPSAGARRSEASNQGLVSNSS
ncbi:uncharacterized protein LOC62_04G006032 [Vanrija pseudolonga]|uniref:Uncharacterized protein n=1 Tax=Vanrija pseudolonga TaxID=143232 RepID=A0AAF0Y999_9TREE|nr:hypothetical protein LOC62_04G006032 [Vanrija pseudolonga]